ncbi:MAG: hypothetical protein LBJ76_06125 [Candidatus Accumulibacter sp.]|jgi:cell division protein ZapB|nr:hypothetical protein [Accumulibacter sp.]
MQQVQNELDRLGDKITEVISLCEALKTENTQLKRQLAAVEKNKSDLSERMIFARTRLEQLVLKLPEDMQIGA